MAPLVSTPKRNKGKTTTMGNYGTKGHDQSSLDEVASLKISITDDETHSLAAAMIHDSSTMISNASSSASNYFMPSHRPSDSLDYSTTSSTDNNEKGYLGSIVRSLGSQQSFPSSMFPGQQLISPVSEQRETIQIQQGGIDNHHPPLSSSSRAFSSYFYYNTSPYQDDRDQVALSRPLSYQNVNTVHHNGSSNAYQKRRQGFCTDGVDDDLDEIDDGSLISSWKRCSKCFFSPRVLLTFAVCGIIVFNLLRYGGHHHRHGQQNHHKHPPNGNENSSEYIKMETIGGSSRSSSSNLRSGSSNLSLFQDVKDPSNISNGSRNENIHKMQNTLANKENIGNRH